MLSVCNLHDEHFLVNLLVHSTCYFCVRLLCNLAFELAMASTASTVDIENSPIQTKEMYIEIIFSSEPDGFMGV